MAATRDGIGEAHAVGSNLEIAADCPGDHQVGGRLDRGAGRRQQPRDRADVPEVLGHQRLDPLLRRRTGEAHRLGDRFLERVGQQVGVASRGHVQERTHAEEEVFRRAMPDPGSHRSRRPRRRAAAARSRRSASMSRSPPGRLFHVRFELVDGAVEPGMPDLHEVEQDGQGQGGAFAGARLEPGLEVCEQRPRRRPAGAGRRARSAVPDCRSRPDRSRRSRGRADRSSAAGPTTAGAARRWPAPRRRRSVRRRRSAGRGRSSGRASAGRSRRPHQITIGVLTSRKTCVARSRTTPSI